MIQIRTTSKAGLFLLELSIVIVCFSLAAALSVQLFAKARQTAVESTDLTMAAAILQSAAECAKEARNLTELAVLVDGKATEEAVIVFYDGEWQPTPAVSQRKLVIWQEKDHLLQISHLKITKGGRAVFELETKWAWREASL